MLTIVRMERLRSMVLMNSLGKDRGWVSITFRLRWYYITPQLRITLLS